MYRAMAPAVGSDDARAELRHDRAARRDRRLHDLPRPADRARAAALAADHRAAQRAGHRHPALPRRRDRAERDCADLAGLDAWHAGGGAFPAALIAVFVAGLLIGLVGLGSAATHFTRQAAMHAENPIVLAAIIAIGIGAHNFGEGLAIGASAAAGATAVALALIVGFGLHNATEGFGVAAPLVGRVVPTWAQIGLAGLIAGGPTFVGTIIGYSFYSPTLSVLFLAIAVGALVFVIGELWSVLRRTGLTASVTATMCAGFLIALATELFLDMNGG